MRGKLFFKGLRPFNPTNIGGLTPLTLQIWGSLEGALAPSFHPPLPLPIKVFKRAIALFTILFPFPLSRGRGYRGWGYLIIIRRGKKTLETGFASLQLSKILTLLIVGGR